MNLNDTQEFKPKIVFNSTEEHTHNIEKQIYESCEGFNQQIKMASFSCDGRPNYKRNPTDELYYLDYSGRGFSYPRMWAQYANNNKGVCIIFNKKKLLEEIKKYYNLIEHNSIRYVNFFDLFEFNEKRINEYKKTVLEKEDSKDVLNFINFLKNNKSYIALNYFRKSKDWYNEREYRILLTTSKETPMFINNIVDYIEGFVIGEQASSHHIYLLKLLIKDQKIEQMIKQIKFEAKYTALI